MSSYWEKLEIVFIAVLLVIFPVFAAYSFLAMPLTDDVRVFIGESNQARMTGLSFPWSVDEAWELKPLGNRILWYVVTGMADIVDSIVTNNGAKIGIQLIAMMMVFIVAGRLSETLIFHVKGNSLLTNIIILLAFIAPFNLFLLQAEWWSTLLSLIALWMLLKESDITSFFAGLILVFVATIKLSTVVMIPTVLIGYLLIAGYDKRSLFRNGFPFSCGVIVGFVFGGMWAIYLDHVMPDIFFAMNVAHASRGVSPGVIDSIVYFVYFAYLQIIAMPILLAGVIAGLAVTCVCIRVLIVAIGEKWEIDQAVANLILFILLWALPVGSIFLQREFFAYHYMILTFPCLVSIIILADILPSRASAGVLYLVIIAMGIFWLMHCSVFSPNFEAQDRFWNDTDRDAALLEEKYHLSVQPTLLYMTNANAPYYFRAKSACRQIGSLPILYNMTGTTEYTETEECFRNYRGEFIIATHEIGNTIPPISGSEISNAMAGRYFPNYARVENMTHWDIYRRVS